MTAANAMSAALIRRFTEARQDPTLVVLEGVHAIKHARRFGVSLDAVCSPNPGAARSLMAALAPDVELADVAAVDDATWRQLVPHDLPSPMLALARRPAVDIESVLVVRDDGPIVLLEEPTHLGNVGASIRVAAAAGAAGVVVLGSADPWHPVTVRGAAGLQFALPVGRVSTLPDGPRPLVAVHPDGDADEAPPPGAILAFGSERRGLSDELLARADHHITLPMQPGVSSLNLATTVSAVLYRHHR